MGRHSPGLHLVCGRAHVHYLNGHLPTLRSCRSPLLGDPELLFGGSTRRRGSGRAALGPPMQTFFREQDRHNNRRSVKECVPQSGRLNWFECGDRTANGEPSHAFQPQTHLQTRPQANQSCKICIPISGHENGRKQCQLFAARIAN